MNGSQLSDELLNLGQAIGLFDDSGNLQTSWFQNPLSDIESILTDSTQRAAFLNLLDDFLPAATVADAPAGESWHPLLGQQPQGNLYLTVANNGSVTFGVAGEFQGPGAGTPQATLYVHLPLVTTNGSSVTAVAGTSNGPLEVGLRVHLGWEFNTDPIGLDSIVVAASLAPLPTSSASANLSVTLEQLQLDSSGPTDVVLDPSNLGSEAVQLIIGLIREKLSHLAGPVGEVAAVVNHLLPLLGFGSDGVPQFPFAQLSTAGALNSWFNSLLTAPSGGGNAPIVAWLGHLAGLIGSANINVSGAGTPASPWTVSLLPIGGVAGSSLNLTLAVQTISSATSLLVGINAVIIPSGANPPLNIEASATIASIPIVGTGSAQILPAASILAVAPGGLGAGNLVTSANITVGSLEAGFNWNGSSLQPKVLLESVTFLGTSYPQLDLTNADSVAAAASAAVRTTIANLLGNVPPGIHVAALAGIVAPVNDPTSTHLINATAMVANPAAAIAAVHRAVLLDAVHNWSFMLEEIAEIAGLAGGVSGTGTRNDPWVVEIAEAGPIQIQLAAWNDQTSGVATDPQKLRIGLRAYLSFAPLTFWWLSELLAFDLPQSGTGTVSLMAGQDAHCEIQPVPSIPDLAGLTLAIGDFAADMNWEPGGSMTWSAGLDNVKVAFAGSTVTIASLKFPAAAAFDVTNPGNIAVSLGISVGDLELLLRMMLARAAFSWGGMSGFTLAGLLGVHAGFPGLPSDWPTLADPGGLGSLLGNPFTALRNWLGQIAINLSADGSAFLPIALGWFRAFFAGVLPSDPSVSLPSFALPISGSGTYDDPWAMPLTTGTNMSVDALVWLEPAGPPTNWATALVAAANSAPNVPALAQVLQSVSGFLPGIAQALQNTNLTGFSGSVGDLSSYLSLGDGVVPYVSQIPSGGSWTAGTTLTSAHPTQPSDPSAIQQILAQIDTWMGGAAASRTVLLLGPAFSDHTIWQTLLASGNLHGTTNAAANFNLRIPNVDPSTIDLTGVTANVNYYTADLYDDGTGNLTSLTSQIGSVVARIQTLTGAAQVVLVGHSTAGVAARAFTSANPTWVKGLITLGSPHLGASLPYMTDPNMGDAVRTLQSIRSVMAANPLRDAFDHIVLALDGYVPATSSSQLPTAAPYPVGSFGNPGSTDTGGRPALALGSQLSGTLLSFLQTAVAAEATSAANPANPPAAPTYLAFGARTHLNFANAVPEPVTVDVNIRGDAFRVALQSGAAAPPHPAHGLRVRASIAGTNGWLVGQPSAYAGPGAAPVDVRVKSAELGVNIYSNGSGGVSVDPELTLYGVSYHGPVLPVAIFTDPNAQALLGAVFQTISNPAPLAGSGMGLLLTALTNLGIAVADSSGGVGVSADAFNAIQADAASFLGPKLAAALNAGLPGFSGTGPWTMPVGGFPFEIYISQNPWTIGLRTISNGVFALANNAGMIFDGNVAIPSFQPTLSASILVGGLLLSWSSSPNQLTAEAQPWLAPITLIPAPSAATLQQTLDNVLPRLLFSAAASGIFEAILGSGYQIPPIDSFFTSTASTVSGPSALGGSTGLSSARITQLLQAINTAAGFPAGPGLTLPGSLQLTASGAGTSADPVKVQLGTSAPIGGAVGITVGVSFDQLMHVTPSGTISLTLTGLPAGAWSTLTITFGASASGVSLVLTPAGGTAIQILPTFSGLGALAGAAEALLPQALDELVSAIGASQVLTLVLDVATALDIYDSVGGFAAHASTLKAMLQTNWLASFSSSQSAPVANAIAALFTGGSPLAGILPGTVSASGSKVQWKLPMSGADSGSIVLSLGWDSSGPTALLGVNSVKLGNGALAINATAGYADGNIASAVSLGLYLENAIGVDLVPTLSVQENGSQFQLQFYPLATTTSTGTVNGPITINLIPPSITIGQGGATALINQWLIPMVADMLFNAASADLASSLWSGGPTLQKVLLGAQIGQMSGANLVVNPNIPDVTTIVTGLISTLASGVSIAITSTLNLAIANQGGRLGISVNGEQDFDIGNYSLSMLFGAPSDWGNGTNAGVAVYLFNLSGGTFTFNPGVSVAGFGLGLSGQDDQPLINLSEFRLGGISLYSFFDIEFASGVSVSSVGGGIELDQMGLPLGQATGGNLGGNNPVAASLLQDDGSGNGDSSSSDDGSSGDSQTVNPPLDVAAWYWGGPNGDSQFHVLFQDSDEPLWIGIHAQFGPLYIDQIGLIPNGNTSVSLVLDASVKIDGLTGEVDELGVTIPYKSVLTPSTWTLTLKGIALSFQAPEITIAGALLENDSGSAIEYDGMLLVQISEFGIVAVGAYSKPSDAQGSYTSIFIFAGVFLIIGIPPVIEIDAIGLGVGYNRELIVPTDIDQIPDFILVAALDDGGAMANDPMGELMQIRTSIPAKRGSFWMAVGLHGTTFEIVHLTAVLYVALDGGVEIGIIGVARMAIPSDDTALVSVELALKARYSSAEAVLSIQAQLTDNSYLFDPDCQLTGGFAYFMWFSQGQFVLTLGGYNPNFQVPTQFPTVPRLGFGWGIPIGPTIKGQCYFALTNSCIMAGGCLELTYGIPCAYVWFTAYADFLISWDPFYYSIDIGISVGATFSIQINVWFVNITVSITVSLGASLTIEGPPLFGTATVNLDVCSVTASFGSTPNPNPGYITDWGTFATKYLYAGVQNGNAFTVNVLSGLVPPEPSGGQPAPGTQSQPWQMVSEFSFQCDTRMPANSSSDFIFGVQDESANTHVIDIAPMNKEAVSSQVVITLSGWNGNGWTPMTTNSTNPDFLVDQSHWTINPTIGMVSEATWHWQDPSNMPAAANTLPEITSVQISGFAVLEGQTALIPIAKLVDPGPSRPLPFSVPWNSGQLITYGTSADSFASLASQLSTTATLSAAKQILSGSGYFSQLRVNTGTPAAGLSAVSARSLTTSRSAPPLLTPLSTGLTMKAVGLAKPPVISVVAPVAPVAMQTPRLRAVMQMRSQPAADAPPPIATTVKKVAAANVVRMAAPQADASGSRLLTVPAPNAPRATKLASSARNLRSPELGWTSGSAHIQQLSQALAALTGNGVAVPAGTTHLWDIPVGLAGQFFVSGAAAFRLTFLTRGGSVVSDREYESAPPAGIAIPARCGMVAVTCLGVPSTSSPITPAFGAVSSAVAPAGKIAATGWQSDNLLPQAGPASILARGSIVTMSQANTPQRNRQAVSATMVHVGDVVVNQSGVETWLPASTQVVMILLDQQDSTAASAGDLALAVTNATLSSNPVRILGGRRRALLYDVTRVTANADHITIANASLTGWRCAGVIGLAGDAQEWAVRFHGKIPQQIVPDGPLTPNGSVTIRLTMTSGGTQ